MKLKLFALLFMLVMLVAVESRKRKTRVRFRASRIQAYGFKVVMRCSIYYPDPHSTGVLLKEDDTGKRTKILHPYSVTKRNGGRKIFIRLIIESFQKNDVGKYVCQNGKTESSVSIKGPGPAPKEPTAEFFAKSYHVVEGGRVALYCVVKEEGDRIFYYSDGRPVPLSSNYKYDTQYKATKLRKDLFGSVYRLQLSNIQNRNQIICCRSGNYAACTKVKVYSKGRGRRRLQFKSSAYSVYPGNSLYPTCTPYENSQIYKITSNDSLIPVATGEGFRSTMGIIRNAAAKDAGYYLCKKGNMHALTRVNFYIRPNDPLGPTTVKVGDDGKIGLPQIQDEVVTGFASTFQWYYLGKNGWKKPIKIASKLGKFCATSSERYILTNNGGGLVIKNITADDAGFYRWQHLGDYMERITYQLKVEK